MLTCTNRKDNPGKLKLITGPTVEPVGLTDFYAHEKVGTANNQDAKIQGFLKSARQQAEAHTGRAFVSQQWRLIFDKIPYTWGDDIDALSDGFPWSMAGGAGPIEIPRPPLISIDAVTCYLIDDTSTSLDVETTFTVDTDSDPGRLALKYGKYWPTNLRRWKAVMIDFTCGYGAAADAVPQPIKEAIVEWAAQMYENRDGSPVANIGGAVVSETNRAYIPANVRAKLAEFRIVKV